MGFFNEPETGNLFSLISSDETITPSPSPIPSPTATPTPLPAVRIHQGDWAFFIGDYDRAKEEFLAAQQSNDDDDIQIAANIGMAHADYFNGNYQDAVEKLTLMIEKAPNDVLAAKAYFFLGQAYQALQDPAQAANAYSQYLSHNPGLIDDYVQELIGDMLYASGDSTAAIAAYQFALQNAEQPIDQSNLQIKIGKAYLASNDHNNAIRIFMDIYNSTSNDYLKAQMNLLTGQSYLALELPEQAYARFQDSVSNYPTAYDSYSGLVSLIEAGIPVSDLDRGIVDYYAQQYAVALDALIRYIQNNPEQDGTALYYKALCLQKLERYDDAIKDWNSLIREKPEDRFWVDAWEDIAYTHWFYQNNYLQAAETQLEFVRERPTAPEAPEMLFSAARLLETDNRLADAAAVWERLIIEYPNHDLSYRALFMAGICYYRLNEFAQSLTIFQRLLVLATTTDDQAAAYLWIGKNQLALNDESGAKSSWQTGAQASPDTYYGIRIQQLLSENPPFANSQNIDLAVDLEKERQQAEEWMRSVFSLPNETDLSSPGTLAEDERIKRSDAFWQLGLYTEAHDELESLRNDLKFDVENSFRLLDYLLQLGFYRSAILTSQQIMDMANIDESTALTVPIYFNHIHYGTYFKEYIMPNAQEYNLDAMLLFSIVWQESLFEGFVQSSAGARGLMQILPSTGKEIATYSGYPPNYQDADLYRPIINLKLGTSYLSRQRDYFDGNLYAALAAYNGGPGNAINWLQSAANDPDLFLEIIRFSETRTYLMKITEIMQTYRQIYGRPQ